VRSPLPVFLPSHVLRLTQSTPADLRLRPRRGKTSLLFPASVDDRDEAEALDLEGDPLGFAREGHILLNLVRPTSS